MTDAPPPPPPPVGPVGLGLATRVLITLAAAAITIAAMANAKEIIGPIVLSIVLVIIAHPVRAVLERKGWQRWAATTAVIVVVYLILLVLGVLLATALAQFARLIADSADAFKEQATMLTDWIATLGLSQSQTEAVTGAVDPSTIFSVALTIAESALSSVTAIVLVFAYTLFMAADGAYVAPIFARFRTTHASVIAALTGYAHGVRQYMVVNAIFGLIVAVLDGLILWALGVPGAFIWAVLAFITNFIPNIGFVIGVIPPAVMALVTGGWGLALIVVAVYCVVNVTLQVLVQPRFVAVAVNLGFTITFVSVIFWGFVLGALGALLAVPLTLLLRLLLLDADPRAGWARTLSGDRTPEEGPRETASEDAESELPESHPAA
ncbi:AI-2E family transporter [Leifsonia flava]|uniref:AI-2E family transporter n=1 Tax=Orlajensenia leifsoniae TaxID=2561933 RepID=A0A4Y9R6T0_9MICO|nr:AI-2E family transporter [Leifsonia flava]TFV99652.1 AI-2E family transporter [Leifsonia flava]